MKIEEKMNQIVTVPEIEDLFRGYTLGLTTLSLICIAFAIIPPHIGSVVPIVMFLFLFGNTFCKKVVIDINSESIIVTKRHFMLIRKETIIPFSDIVGISKEHKEYGSGPAEWSGYEVNIFTINMNMWKIRIYRGGDESEAEASRNEKMVRNIIGIDKRKKTKCIYCGEIFYHESLERCPYCFRVIEEKEYKENEEVLQRVKCKLSCKNKNPEEAECFITEGHVVIEAEETIKIPINHIKHVRESSDIGLIQSASFAALHQGALKGTVTLSFFNDLDKKHELSLEMSIMDAGYLKNVIDDQVAK